MEKTYPFISAYLSLLNAVRDFAHHISGKHCHINNRIVFIATLVSLLLLCLMPTNSVLGQITQRGSATTNTGTNTITINKPTGVIAGDVLIVNIVQNDNDNAILSNATLSGWNLIDGKRIYEFDPPGSNNNTEWWGTVLYRVADGTEGTNFTFTCTSADMSIGSIVAFYNVDAAGGVKADGTSGGPFDVDPGTINLTTASTLTAPAITTNTNNALVIMLGQVADNDTYSAWTTTSPGTLNEGYDNTTSDGDDASVGAAWAINTTTGNTGNGTATLSGNDRNGAILIALKSRPDPTITSFTPTNACYGSLASVVITGTNFTGTTSVTFNGVSAAFTVNSTTQITATLPATATTGTISITNTYGTGTSANSFIVNALPTVTASAAPTEVCSGSDVTLTVSATPATYQATLLSENFNNATNNWTTLNNSTLGTPANAAWTLMPDGYTYNTTTFNSNDASQFYLSNSDAQGNGSTTATILQSPAMNTTGFSSLTLEYYHYYRFNASESAKVEISEDGSNWTTLTTYTSTQGAANGFVLVNVNLDSYTNKATLYIRFKYDASWDWYWAIDNVTITGTRTYNYTWSATPPATAGLPAGAGTPSPLNASIIANPTLNTSYIATAVNTTTGCSASSAGIAVTVLPINITWVGGTSNDWHEASNWDPQSVPTTCADVSIPSAATKFPTISANAFCHNLKLESGASIIDEASHLTVSGTSTMIRTIDDARWHFLSSPVGSQEIWPEFAPTPTGAPLSFGPSPWNWDFYYYNPNCQADGLVWVNLRNNDGTYNSGVIDEGSNFAGFGPSTPTMTVAKGYLVAYASGYTPTIHSFSGTLNTGDKTISFPNSVNVYNLIGNPYPSSLDWMYSGWDFSDLEKSGIGYDYWIMNDGVGTISGNYVVFNSGGTGSTTASKDIAPGQAFWVKAKATGTLNLTIPNAARTHSTQAWLKNSNSETNLIRLHLKTSGNTYSDEMIVDINPEYSGTEGSDKLWSFYAEAPEIYSIKGGNNYTIDRYKDLSTNLTVNIGTKTGIAADYTITATNIQDFNLSSKVLLEDLKTGIVTDLKQTPAYTFAGAPGDEANRFRLIIGSPIGIDEPNTNGSFNIYTYENMVYVQNDKTNEPYFVTVSNMLGQTLVRTDFTGNSLNRIEIKNVPGVYVVNVVSNGKTYSQKVVIR